MMLRMSLDIVPRLADVDDDADRQQCFWCSDFIEWTFEAVLLNNVRPLAVLLNNVLLMQCFKEM